MNPPSRPGTPGTDVVPLFEPFEMGLLLDGTPKQQTLALFSRCGGRCTDLCRLVADRQP